MKIRMTSALLLAVALAAPGLAQAQSRSTQLGAGRQAPPPATAARTNPVLPGAPSASGLASPFAPSTPSLAVPGTSAEGTAAFGTDANTPPSSLGVDMGATAGTMTTGPANAPTNAATYPATSVMGAGAYGTRGMARPTAGPVSDVDIARSFLMADGNRDGELSRAEATRLTILPLSFEEMDANHDDRLTRSEYEEAVR